ncbi:MAG: NifU family protein [Erysipelotrichaceae bacterium]|nr:NifU family protein [Erysipelotrichaceae bacterium]
MIQLSENTENKITETDEREGLIKKIISHLRPYIMGDGGDIEFVSLEDDIVYIRLLGACVGCSMIDVTLNNGIKNWIMEEVPSVKDVVMVQDVMDNSSLYSF